MWVRVVRSFDALNVGDMYEIDDCCMRSLDLLERGYTERMEEAPEAVAVAEGNVDGGEVPAGAEQQSGPVRRNGSGRGTGSEGNATGGVGSPA